MWGSALQHEGKNKYPPSPRSNGREEKADEDSEISIHVRTYVWGYIVQNLRTVHHNFYLW